MTTMSDPIESLSQFHEVSHHRVTVEYRTPALDWLDRLRSHDRRDRCCAECLGDLAGETPIYVNTEGPSGDDTTADLFCSWACLLRTAARCYDGTPQAGITVTTTNEGTEQ